MNNKRRVFITGYGSVNCLDGEEGLVETLARLGRQFATAGLNQAGRVGEKAFAPYADDRITRRMDRFTLMAYVAVRKALSHAGLDLAGQQADRVGIIMNTCYGPLDSTRRYIIKLIRDGARKVPAAVFPNTVHNAFTGLITMALAAHGSNSTVSGQNPVCYGLDMIREGRDDLMIVGGCDELLTSMTNGFAASGLLGSGMVAGSAGVFDREANTLALGEGAAVLILESEASVRSRGARVFAEVLDYGMTNGLSTDAAHAFPGDEKGLQVAMQQALARSALAPQEIDFVSAACNGLPRLARAEINALALLFGQGPRPLVSNIKPAIGETLGAASVFAAMLAVDALQASSAPPVPGLPAGYLPERFVTSHAVAGALAVALVNGIEMGGTMTSLALRKVELNADGRLD